VADTVIKAIFSTQISQELLQGSAQTYKKRHRQDIQLELF